MSKRTLYLECYSGISGDMTVAALLDLGADKDVLLNALKSLNVDGYEIVIGRRAKNSIDACDFDVILEEGEHGHEHGSHPASDSRHSHEYPHEHSHEHAPHSTFAVPDPMHLGHHEHRNLNDIYSIIDQSGISENARDIAKKVFHIVAAAESKSHGKPIEEVHFHEVGAVDSIVDIVAAAVCLDNLKIEEVIVSELYEGTGHITCQHGILPIPVPAVVNISAEYHIPLHITSVKGELVTPTGAAIVAAIKTGDTLPKEFRIERIGLGAGKRDYETAGILRAMLIEDLTKPFVSTAADRVWVLEANIDDCSGEALSIAMELLFQNGAKDVYYTPIYMKKNRPAYMLSVICGEEHRKKLEEIIFTHTTTIGVRRHETLRTILDREVRTVSTPHGDALVKVCHYDGKTFYYPECESVKKLCVNADMDYMTMYSLIRNLAEEVLI